MYCTKCGKQITEGEVCSCQQGQQPIQTPEQTPPQPSVQPPISQPQVNVPFQAPAPADNRRLYSILAYVPFLWLFGLLINPERTDSRVRFNVGQGIILTIITAGASVVAAVLSSILKTLLRTKVAVSGTITYYEPSGAATAISALLWLAVIGGCITLIVIGIMKVNRNQDDYLPIIGKLAFYR